MTEWDLHAEVSFQGELGAYSEAAVHRIFGPTAKPKPCKNFSDVFRDVWTYTTKYGVVPIENSIEGSVSPVYDLFLQYDLKVCGELPLKISHCLIANPETDLEAVKVVYSHPQALGQCRNYLEGLGIDLVSTYDTAGSVKMIKEQGLTNAAAIAGERAAQIYGMKILAKDIADTQNNYTRFFVLSKGELPPTGNDKTSIIFSTKHVPGALYEALGELATRGVNMTKIESRPTKQNLWEYNFYLDFDGHMNEQICTDALDALRTRSLFVKVLGSYPRGIE
ncbi:MAG: prephenate dehydratase [Candidatus Thorarchaeota archaeon]|nr:prephenate dehydratase [Candidatus Thorarchaeota archaeon]